jgi:hypothetical protein
MSIELETGLYGLLTGNSPQTSAVGRVYPRLPQGVTFPAVRYQRISSNRNHSLDDNVGVTDVSMQIDCMAATYTATKTLADEVRTILHGYQGAWGTLICRMATLETENDLEYVEGDDVTHWVSQRYRIYTNMD